MSDECAIRTGNKSDEVRLGLARRGVARHGGARSGEAGCFKTKDGVLLSGLAGRGETWRGLVWLGRAGHGKARRGASQCIQPTAGATGMAMIAKPNAKATTKQGTKGEDHG